MYNILASGGANSSFSRSDFLADVDSAVIYKTLFNIQMESFEDYFEYHYQYNYHSRCSLFITGKTYDEFLFTANAYLSLTPILTFILNILQQYQYEFTYLTNDQRRALADAFVDYFWECLNNE